jgi:hypothetical protein
MARSKAGIEMAVWWWMYVPKLNSVNEPDSKVQCVGNRHVVISHQHMEAISTTK